MKKSGAYAVKGATVTCPAASTAACTLTVSPLKGKKSLGPSQVKVNAGATAQIGGRLSKKALKQLKAAGTKVSISVLVAVPGGDPAAGSVAATMVPPKAKKRPGK